MSRKGRKVITAILLTALFFFGLFVPDRVFAADGDFTVQDGVLLKYNGSGGNVVIPDSVTVIGDAAFSGCTGIVHIEIPNSVVKIGKEAFKNCTGLTQVTIPESVKEIGSQAFFQCTNLENIGIPESVTDIGAYAFHESAWWKNKINEADAGLVIINHILLDGKRASGNVVIPDSVKKIADGAFAQCEGVTGAVIPNGVTEIGYAAFWQCKGLIKAEISDSVTQIGDSVFQECEQLTEISLPRGLTAIPHALFNGCKSLKSIVIPDSVTEIGKHAFRGCEQLTDVSLPDGLTVISDHLFRQCTNLKRVVIPDGVTVIGNRAFRECTHLTDVSIPDSVTKIGMAAFYQCESLTDITIPSGVTVVERHTFFQCKALAGIGIPAGVTQIGGAAFTGTAWLKQQIADSSDSLVIVNRILIDGSTASGSVIIPDTVERIAGWTFYKNQKITGVQLGRIKEIEYGAFWNCTGLTKIDIPDSVEKIGEKVFGLTGLKAVSFPESVKEIGCGAVLGCSDLEEVTVENAAADIMSAAAQDIPNIFGVRGGSDEEVNVYQAVGYKDKAVLIRGHKDSSAYHLAMHLDAYKGDYGYRSVQFEALDSVDAKVLLAQVKVTPALNISIGKSAQIKVTLPKGLVKTSTYTGEDGQVKITYKTGNKKVAAVNSKGKIVGKGKGSTKITATVRLQDGTKKGFYTKIKVK